jgi:aryl-alcohol dehydrogenase-like predicted oxidoreductase
LIERPLPRRPFTRDVQLSILGLGGMTLVGMDQSDASRLVAEALDRGVNYFDVAPFYGDGEAETKLGAALHQYRRGAFLACKTLVRNGSGARSELERSLTRLRTDHFDLYQFHALTTLEEVEQIFAPAGAAEAFLRAREQGLVRFIGFSAHSVEAACAMLDRFAFDSVLFPVNYVCYARAAFGPQVMEKAKRLGVARIALKALADRKWHRDERREYPNCWYKPIADDTRALDALRFSLSEDVTAALPPGDQRLFRMTVELAARFTPLTAEERRRILDSARTVHPLWDSPSPRFAKEPDQV